MIDQEQKRMDKALPQFTREFIANIPGDIVTNYAFNQLIKGNACKAIERMVDIINHQKQTIDNLVTTYCTNYVDAVKPP